MDDLKRCKQCGAILQGWFEEENGQCEDCLLKAPCANCDELVYERDMVQSFYAEGWMCKECAGAIEEEVRKHDLHRAS